MTNEQTKKLTITLTEHPPVRINIELWPVLAQGHDHYYDSEHKCQANRTAHWHLIVRHNSKTGRALVYGIYTYETAWLTEKGYDIRAGRMLDAYSAESCIAALQSVAEQMREKVDLYTQDTRAAVTFTRLLDEAIGDMPEMELAGV